MEESSEDIPSEDNGPGDGTDLQEDEDEDDGEEEEELTQESYKALKYALNFLMRMFAYLLSISVSDPDPDGYENQDPDPNKVGSDPQHCPKPWFCIWIHADPY